MVKITSHTLVKNEERFVWFAVMSVIDHVDKILLWDTGSTDNTFEICKEIKKAYPQKIDLQKIESVTSETFPKIRQKMLDETKTDWFIVVDGDEVWWQDSIRHLVSEIKKRGKLVESIVVPTINLIGDIYHYQEETAGQYHLAGRVGHYNLRAVSRSIPGLHSMGEHGVWGWVDKENKMIQDRKDKMLFVNAPYLHATHLPRAGESVKEDDVPKRKQKLKYELGIPFPTDFYYPEVFFRKRPDIIPSPWIKRTTPYVFRATLETPLKMAKRRLPFFKKIGY